MLRKFKILSIAIVSLLCATLSNAVTRTFQVTNCYTINNDKDKVVIGTISIDEVNSAYSVKIIVKDYNRNTDRIKAKHRIFASVKPRKSITYRPFTYDDNKEDDVNKFYKKTTVINPAHPKTSLPYGLFQWTDDQQGTYRPYPDGPEYEYRDRDGKFVDAQKKEFKTPRNFSSSTRKIRVRGPHYWLQSRLFPGFQDFVKILLKVPEGKINNWFVALARGDNRYIKNIIGLVIILSKRAGEYKEHSLADTTEDADPIEGREGQGTFKFVFGKSIQEIIRDSIDQGINLEDWAFLSASTRFGVEGGMEDLRQMLIEMQMHAVQGETVATLLILGNIFRKYVYPYLEQIYEHLKQAHRTETSSGKFIKQHLDRKKQLRRGAGQGINLEEDVHGIRDMDQIRMGVQRRTEISYQAGDGTYNNVFGYPTLVRAPRGHYTTQLIGFAESYRGRRRPGEYGKEKVKAQFELAVRLSVLYQTPNLALTHLGGLAFRNPPEWLDEAITDEILRFIIEKGLTVEFVIPSSRQDVSQKMLRIIKSIERRYDRIKKEAEEEEEAEEGEDQNPRRGFSQNILEDLRNLLPDSLSAGTLRDIEANLDHYHAVYIDLSRHPIKLKQLLRTIQGKGREGLEQEITTHLQQPRKKRVAEEEEEEEGEFFVVRPRVRYKIRQKRRRRRPLGARFRAPATTRERRATTPATKRRRPTTTKKRATTPATKRRRPTTPATKGRRVTTTRIRRATTPAPKKKRATAPATRRRRPTTTRIRTTSTARRKPTATTTGKTILIRRKKKKKPAPKKKTKKKRRR